MRFSFILVFFTISLGESKPAINCQNKHHAAHEQLQYSRDLLPEQTLYDILYYALDVSINPAELSSSTVGRSESFWRLK